MCLKKEKQYVQLAVTAVVWMYEGYMLVPLALAKIILFYADDELFLSGRRFKNIWCK